MSTRRATATTLLALLLLSSTGALAQTVFWRPEERLTCEPEEGNFSTSLIKRIDVNGPLSANTTVRVRIVGGSATFGEDFDGELDDVFVLREGETQGTLWGIQTLDDSLEEGPETVEVELSVSGGASLAGPSRALIVLLDDETRQPGDFTRCFQELEQGNLTVDITPAVPIWNPENHHGPFELTVANDGGEAARDVVVRSVVPAYTQFDPEGSSEGWVCPDGRGEGRVCTFTFGELAAGETRTLDFVTRVDESTPEVVQLYAEAVVGPAGEGSVAGSLTPAGSATAAAREDLAGPCFVPGCRSDATMDGESSDPLALFCGCLMGIADPFDCAFGPGGSESGGGAIGMLRGIFRNGLGSVRAAAELVADAGTLLQLRDRVLRNDAGGRRALELFHRYGVAMVSAASDTTGYYSKLGQAAQRWMPALRSLVEGDGDVPVTAQMAQDYRDFFEDLYPRLPAPIRTVAVNQLDRVDPESWVGRPVRDALTSFSRLECADGNDTPQSLCLNHDRFRVEVAWEDFQGGAGRGRREILTGDTGTFWFFDSANVELVVKVLDARPVNGHFWVFYGSLSNVGYQMTVTDTETGAVRRYQNPSGTFASAGDTVAFPGSGSSSTASPEPGRLAASSWHFAPAPAQAQPGVELVAGGSAGSTDWSARREATHGGCHPAATTHCLTDDRFRVEVTWSDFQGGSGEGRAVPMTGDTGAFWFFDSANIELVVKVLDARAVNGRFWVFYGALSNVEYDITVTDTETGAQAIYRNPSGTFASAGDTDAFDG